MLDFRRAISPPSLTAFCLQGIAGGWIVSQQLSVLRISAADLPGRIVVPVAGSVVAFPCSGGRPRLP